MSLVRLVALSDGRCKATFEDGTVLALSRDARAFVVAGAAAAPAACAAAAASAAPAAASELHSTDLALRRHRPLVAQALAVRSAYLLAWRPYAPAWLVGPGEESGGGQNDDNDNNDPLSLAATAAAKAELLLDRCAWWLDPRDELPPTRGPGAALLLWTPGAVMSVVLPSSSAPLEAEARVRWSAAGGGCSTSFLRTTMGGRFFLEEKEQAGKTKRRTHSSSALPGRLKGVAVRLLRMRAGAVAAAELQQQQQQQQRPLPPTPAAAATPTTITVPGLGQFEADGGLVRAAFEDGTLVHLSGGEARVTLPDGRLVVTARRGGGGARAGAAAAAAYFGGGSLPPPSCTPAIISAAVALAEDFGEWAMGGAEARERWCEGARQRRRLEAAAGACARTADALCGGGRALALPEEEEEEHRRREVEAAKMRSDPRGAVLRTLRRNSDVLEGLEGEEEKARGGCCLGR
jgi:hypothetical protein